MIGIFSEIPTVYSKLNVGVPSEVLNITSTVVPSSQTSPPPDTTTTGNWFTVIVVASVIELEQLLASVIFVKLYIELIEGLTEIESNELLNGNGVADMPLIS